MEIKSKYDVGRRVIYNYKDQRLVGVITGIELKGWYYSSHNKETRFIDYWIDHRIKVSEELIYGYED